MRRYTGVEGLVGEWILQEKFDNRCIDALRIIAKCMHLDHSSPNQKSHIYVINNVNEDYNLMIDLKVVKGSIMTCIYNRLARYDEELHITLTTHVPKHSLLHKISSHTSSQSSSNESGEQSVCLLYARGLDPHTHTLTEGTIHYTYIQTIMDYLNVDMVGVSAFTSLFMQLLVYYPLFKREGGLRRPMPVTCM
ncbi:hypothetical protein EON64_12100 [archaeon]|nr:MAG: hypothetical protein EON64_12100 [archaeon]